MLPAIPEVVRELSQALTNTENRGLPPPTKLEVKGASEKCSQGASNVERASITITMEWTQVQPAEQPHASVENAKPRRFRVLTWFGQLLRWVPVLRNIGQIL